jgi:hypothetical protein
MCSTSRRKHSGKPSIPSWPRPPRDRGLEPLK